MPKSPGDSHQKNLSEGVLEKIKAGEVKMRPRAYFTLKVALVVLVAFCAFVATSLLMSFVIFSLRVSGRLFLLGFGAQGVMLFLRFFPWNLLLFIILFLVLLEWLLKRFSFGWKRSFSSMVAIIFLSSTLAAVLLFIGSFHEQLEQKARKGQLPVFGGMYKDSRRPMPDQGIFRGQVQAIRGNTFVLHEEDEPNETGHLIYAPDNVKLVDIIHVGDLIFVATVDVNGQLHAVGIKRLYRPATASSTLPGMFVGTSSDTDK